MSSLSTYVVTFNCGRSPIQPPVFASHLYSGLSKISPPPEILVLCLQEIAPIAYAFLGGSYLESYLQRFEQPISIAAKAVNGKDYTRVAAHHVGMTAIMMFVEQKSVEKVGKIQFAEIGVGLWAMANKGAAGIRMDYLAKESATMSLTFVSTHLAAMEWACKRRNEDWKNIVRGLVFESTSEGSSDHSSSVSEATPLLTSSRESAQSPSSSVSGMYTPTSHLIIAGDLNYRTSSTGPGPEDHSSFPQPCEDDSYPRHYWHLFSSDQLTAEMKADRTCQGLKEAPLDFPPTYKYSERVRNQILNGEVKAERMDDVDEGRWDWAKHRWPSWCDRILYLDTPSQVKGAKIEVKGYTALPLMVTSDHRPVACTFRIPAVAIPMPDGEEVTEGDFRSQPPFAIDPYWKRRRRFARQLEVFVGILAFLTTTWEAVWIFSALVLFMMALGTGIFWWELT